MTTLTKLSLVRASLDLASLGLARDVMSEGNKRLPELGADLGLFKCYISKFFLILIC